MADPFPSAQACALGLMTDHLDIVALGINHKGRVVVRMVHGANSGSPIVLGPGRQSGGMELLDLLAICTHIVSSYLSGAGSPIRLTVGCKGKMGGRHVAIGGRNPEVGAVSRPDAEADGLAEVHDLLVTEGLEGGDIEVDCLLVGVLDNADTGVIDRHGGGCCYGVWEIVGENLWMRRV